MSTRKAVSWATAAAVVVALVGTATASYGTTTQTCTTTTLPAPDGAEWTQVAATEPTGRFQAGVSRGSDHNVLQVVLWKDGVVRTVATGDNRLSATGVNRYGHIVGNRVVGDVQRAWRYKAGSRADLPAPGADWSTRAVAITAGGTVAGTTTDPATGAEQPVAWTYGGLVRLAVPQGYNAGTVAGIDGDGTVVGNVYVWDGSMPTGNQPIVWFADGTYRLLPAGDGWASHIRGGLVVGAANTADGTVLVSWRARGGGMTVVSTAHQGAYALNGPGAMVVYISGTGYGLFQNGAVQPIDPQFDRIAGLTDANAVYGSGGGAAGRWECTA